MARRKRVRQEKTPEGGIRHVTEFVDTKTGQVFPAPESVRTKEEFAEIRELPEAERREPLIAAAREREGLEPVPTAREKAAAGVELEAAGAFEEVIPEKVSLEPEEQFGAKIPVIGPSTAALQSVLKDIVPEFLKGKKAEEFPLTEESIRELALREIRQKSFDEGISISEAFGSFIESIPLVGNRARAWAGGLIEQPSTNAENVLKHVNDIREAASTGQEKVRNGLEDPDYGLDRARSMEEDLAKLEGRMKLLIITSAVLRANTDQVNEIEERILEAREKVSRYRQASTFGLTAQLTGTGRIIPTDELMLLELKGGG